MSSSLLLTDDADTSTVTRWRIHLRDRVAARVRAFVLDQALAQGTPPDSSAALALRAQALLGARRELGDQIRQLVQGVDRPPRPPSASIRLHISRPLVAAVEPELTQLAVRLLADEQVDVRGVASSELLLRDGAISQHIGPTEPGRTTAGCGSLG
jgi:hypothetical protein